MDLQTVLASCVSSVASRIICYPLDTIAIQHASSTRRPIFSVPLLSYYRGMGASILTVTPATALYLTTYRASKEKLLPHLGNSTANFLASGTIAELVSSVIWTPIEVIKARLQIAKTAEDGRLLPNVREIYKGEGMKGFYRGYLLGLLVFIPYNGIWWTTYEHTKLVSPFDAPFAQAACGAISGTTLSTLICHPVDMIKTRYQVSMSRTISSTGTRNDDRRGVKFVVRNLVKEAGWRGLYLGLGPRLLCSVPGSLIGMSVFEYINPDLSAQKSLHEDVDENARLQAETSII